MKTSFSIIFLFKRRGLTYSYPLFISVFNTYLNKMPFDAYDGVKLAFKVISDVFFREIKVR